VLPSEKLSITLSLPSLCRADTTLIFLDSTDTVQYTRNGVLQSNGPGCPGAENFACIVNDNGASPTSDVDLSFNIFEQDGVTLSDTLQIIGRVGLGVSSVFTSDTEGSTLPALAGGTSITENGDIQQAGTVPIVGGSYIIEFQSDRAEVPEPRLNVLLTLIVLGITLAAKRRKLFVDCPPHRP
jgi:hypothetical protein